MSTKKTKAVQGGAVEAKSLGRPSSFTQDLASEICRRLGEGEPLAQICRDAHMPAVRTVSDWKRASEAFSAAIACAREDGFDQIATDCLRIADDGLNDTYVDGDGNKRTDTDVIARSRLRIETRLKLLSKWDPKRYGDKVQNEHTGPDGGPIQHQVKQLSDDELDDAIAKAAAALGDDREG